MTQLLSSAPRLLIKFFSLAICIYLLLFCCIPEASANDNQQISIGVSPAVIEVAGSAGQQIQRELTISNQTGIGLPVSTKVESLIDTDEVISSSIRQQFDGSSWISLDEESFLMGTDETKKIPVMISIPKDATPGGHYAQISIRGLTLENGKLEGSGTSIVVPEITVSVFITVAGYINERLNLASSDIFGITVAQGSEKLINFNIENRGNVHALVVPMLILEKNGKEYSKTALTPKVILPNSIKSYSETWQVPKPSGIYSARIEFSYGNSAKTVASPNEKVAVMPPVWKLILLATAVLLIRYVALHHKNLKKAYKVLVSKA